MIETWSPKEIAMFSACICRFEKEFDVFVYYVSFFLHINFRLKQRVFKKFMNFTGVGSKLSIIAYGNKKLKNELNQSSELI